MKTFWSDSKEIPSENLNSSVTKKTWKLLVAMKINICFNALQARFEMFVLLPEVVQIFDQWRILLLHADERSFIVAFAAVSLFQHKMKIDANQLTKRFTSLNLVMLERKFITFLTQTLRVNVRIFLSISLIWRCISNMAGFFTAAAGVRPWTFEYQKLFISYHLRQ